MTNKLNTICYCKWTQNSKYVSESTNKQSSESTNKQSNCYIVNDIFIIYWNTIR